LLPQLFLGTARSNGSPTSFPDLTRENTLKVFADRRSPLAKARGVIDTGAAS